MNGSSFLSGVLNKSTDTLTDSKLLKRNLPGIFLTPCCLVLLKTAFCLDVIHNHYITGKEKICLGNDCLFHRENIENVIHKKKYILHSRQTHS